MSKPKNTARASERTRDPISVDQIKRILADATNLRVSEDAGEAGRLVIYELLREIADFVKPILRAKKAQTVDLTMLEDYVTIHGKKRYNVLVPKKKVNTGISYSVKDANGESRKVQYTRNLPEATIVRIFKQEGVDRVTELAKEALVNICEEKIRHLGLKAKAFADACGAKTILGRHIEAALELMNH